MSRVFVTCPCCGRGLPLESIASPTVANERGDILKRGKTVMRGLDDEGLAKLAEENGGRTWTKRGRGVKGERGKIENVLTFVGTPVEVLSELIRRCRAFLKAHE